MQFAVARLKLADLQLAPTVDGDELSPLQCMLVLLLQGYKVMLLGVLLLKKQDLIVCSLMGLLKSPCAAVLLQCNTARALGSKTKPRIKLR